MILLKTVVIYNKHTYFLPHLVRLARYLELKIPVHFKELSLALILSFHLIWCYMMAISMAIMFSHNFLKTLFLHNGQVGLSPIKILKFQLEKQCLLRNHSPAASGNSRYRGVQVLVFGQHYTLSEAYAVCPVL